MEDLAHTRPPERRRDEVPVPRRDAPREQHDVGRREPSPEDGQDLPLVVPRHAEGDGDPTRLAHEGLQGGAVAVPDGGGREPAGRGGPDLVPRDPDGHAGREEDPGPHGPEGGEHRRDARRDDRPRRDRHAPPPRVGAAPVDAGPRPGPPVEEDEGAVSQGTGVLPPYDGVGAPRERRPRHDEGRAAGAGRPARPGPGEHGLEDRQGLAAPEGGLGGPDRVAVQGGPVEGRLVPVRPHGGRQQEPGRLGQGDPPRAAAPRLAEHEADRLVEREEAGHPDHGDGAGAVPEAKTPSRARRPASAGIVAPRLRGRIPLTLP